MRKSAEAGEPLRKRKTNGKFLGEPGAHPARTPPAPCSCCSTANAPECLHFAPYLLLLHRTIHKILSSIISALKTLPLNNVFVHKSILHRYYRVQSVQQPGGETAVRKCDAREEPATPTESPAFPTSTDRGSCVPALGWGRGNHTLSPCPDTLRGQSLRDEHWVPIKRKQRWTPHKSTWGVTGQGAPPPQQLGVQQPQAQRIYQPSLRPRTLCDSQTESQREKKHLSKCLPINTFFLEKGRISPESIITQT